MPQGKGSVQFNLEREQLRGLYDEAVPKELTPGEIDKMYKEFYKLHPEADPENLQGPLYSPEEANALYESYAARDPRENILAYMFPPTATAEMLPALDTMTQRHFRYGDLDRMRDVYEQQRGAYYAGMAPQNQGFVRNAPQVPVDRFVPYEEYSQLSFMPSMQSRSTPFSRLHSMVDQETRLAPFVGGGYYTQAPEGTYLHNLYNEDGLSREVNVLLPKRSQK